jgi:hypothetical protein
MTGMHSSVYPGSTWKNVRVEITVFFYDIILVSQFSLQGAYITDCVTFSFGNVIIIRAFST